MSGVGKRRRSAMHKDVGEETAQPNEELAPQVESEQKALLRRPAQAIAHALKAARKRIEDGLGDRMPPEGSRTRPFVTVVGGHGKQRVPLVAEARLDGYGRLGLISLFSDHMGLEALRSPARDFGIGRGAPATHDEIEKIVLNPSMPWAIPTVAVPDADLPHGMQGDEVVLNQRKHLEDVASLLKAGVVVDVGQRCSTGSYRNLIVGRVLFDAQSQETKVSNRGPILVTPREKSMTMVIGDGSVSKPRGRAPEGSVWDSTNGAWVPWTESMAVPLATVEPSRKKAKMNEKDELRELGRPCVSAEAPAASQTCPASQHGFTVYEEQSRTWRKCCFCKQRLQGTCVKHEDPSRKERVRKKEKAAAKTLERYADARRERRLAEMGAGERYWHDYFESYRCGLYENWDEDSGEASELASVDRSGAEDTYRDFSFRLHIDCFAKYKSKAWCKKNMTAPAFEGGLRPAERERAAHLFRALRGDEDEKPEESQQRGVLTEKQFAMVQAKQEALGKIKVTQLRAMLERSGQAGLSGKPKYILVERLAEMQVLGSLTKCPRCKGGRQGKGGNLVWNRVTDEYTCSGYFGVSGPVSCKGPSADAIVRRTWQE